MQHKSWITSRIAMCMDCDWSDESLKYAGVRALEHHSLNPVLRAKRQQVTRWVRINSIYTTARPDESFAELRERVA